MTQRESLFSRPYSDRPHGGAVAVSSVEGAGQEHILGAENDERHLRVEIPLGFAAPHP